MCQAIIYQTHQIYCSSIARGYRECRESKRQNPCSSHSSKSPITILSDNGSEFHKEFDSLIQEKKLEHLWAYPRSSKQNAHNERFNRTIQESFIQYNQDLLFKNPKRFEEKLRKWIEICNTKIPHKSLNYRTSLGWSV